MAGSSDSPLHKRWPRGSPRPTDEFPLPWPSTPASSSTCTGPRFPICAMEVQGVLVSGDDLLAAVHVSQRSTIGRMEEFVPRDFDVPRRLETPQFVLEPLDPEHNDSGLRRVDLVEAAHPRDARVGGTAAGGGRCRRTRTGQICSAMPTTSATGRGSRTRCSIRRAAM